MIFVLDYISSIVGETYYEVLEIDADASRDEIQAAYRERALETHPDHNDAPDAAEQFTRVSTAKSVLTDGTERARYDRLGHDSYVKLAQRTAGSSDSSDDNSNADDSSDETSENATRSGTRTTTATGSGTATSGAESDERASDHRSSARTNHTRTGTGRRHSRTSSDRDGRTASHHGRQRERRQRRTAQQRAADGWPFESGAGDRGGSSSTTATAGTATGAAASQSDENAESGFRYTVHDWEGEIDLEWDGQPVDQSTAVTIGCLWLLYPVFVAASLTAVFPTVVNGIVAACTLAFVGYLLTRPRIATALFGSWSLVFPLGMLQAGSLTPFSITGIVALGSVWVPFGYAVALWWALRP